MKIYDHKHRIKEVIIKLKVDLFALEIIMKRKNNREPTPKFECRMLFWS